MKEIEAKCIKCNKRTNMICHRCNVPICSEHSYNTHHRFYCATCFLRERRLGLIKIWIGLIIICFIAWAVLKNMF